MEVFIVTQNTGHGKYFFIAKADNEDAAILLVDETYGMRGATYSARAMSEPMIYISSIMKPRNQRKETNA